MVIEASSTCGSRMIEVPPSRSSARLGLQTAVDQIGGYVLGAIVVIIGIGVLVSFGAMGLGRLLHMPQVTKGGTVSLAAVSNLH